MAKSYSAVVWYEYENQPPQCHRETVSAGSPASAASRALRAARRAMRGKRPTSILVRLENAALVSAGAILGVAHTGTEAG